MARDRRALGRRKYSLPVSFCLSRMPFSHIYASFRRKMWFRGTAAADKPEDPPYPSRIVHLFTSTWFIQEIKAPRRELDAREESRSYLPLFLSLVLFIRERNTNSRLKPSAFFEDIPWTRTHLNELFDWIEREERKEKGGNTKKRATWKWFYLL